PTLDSGFEGGQRQASADLLPTLDDLTSSATPPEARPPQPVYESTDAFAHVGTAQIPTAEGRRDAGLALRLGAAVLDLILFGGLALAGWMVTGSTTVTAAIFAGLGGITILVGWALAGTSPGKKALSIEVQGPDGSPRLGFLRAAIRGAGGVLCLLTLGIGFLMAAFAKDRKGLHDRIAGTTVRRS
ncbi:MAG: RDD family protein, partial [Holophagales bacterium]|nr:RDD family protein [Holophagales bacterium]